ncbi:RNA polymerase sigma factor [Lysinibacillus piscis]|uniref:RNA polymerase sigma factor n=2 Tax=Lysinibacillus piscis TaxID=2518931 RepID=A0ABQ5NQD1_9BACI|nr:RNA polymerase sigma factor [Lysinibacillus sp. KH24]
MMTNEHLMITYQEGDNEAFNQLYHQLHRPLYSFLFRYTNEEQLSIDIVQDTFEQLQKKRHDFDVAKGTVQSYIFQIGYRLLLNKLNRRKKWRSFFPFLVPIQATTFSTDDKLAVQQAIAKLPEKQRGVVLLAYYHDLQQEDIAKILEIPVGTVKSRLHQALKRLKEELKEDFYAEG